MRLQGTYHTIENAMDIEFRKLLTDDNFWKGYTWADFPGDEIGSAAAESDALTSTKEQKAPFVPSAFSGETLRTLEPTRDFAEGVYHMVDSQTLDRENSVQMQDRAESSLQPRIWSPYDPKTTVARNKVLQGRIRTNCKSSCNAPSKAATYFLSSSSNEEGGSLAGVNTIDPMLLVLSPSQLSQLPLDSHEVYSRDGSPHAQTPPLACSSVKGSRKKETESRLKLGSYDHQ